jgi:DNA-binding XRE family transcriptional regulator
MSENSLKEIRESLMISKTELARKANISPITITRIEQGLPCRNETKRKIILALGYKVSDMNKVFAEDMELFVNDKSDRRSGVERRQFLYDKHIPEQRTSKNQNRRSGLDRRQKPRISE